MKTNKIRITFSITQKLSGHLKNVCVIGRSIDQCWEILNKKIKHYHSFSANVLKVENVDTSFPSGVFQANSQVVVSYRNVASVMCGAALPVSEPHSTNQI